MILDWMGEETERSEGRGKGRRQGRDGRRDRHVDVIAQGNHAGNALSDDELSGEERGETSFIGLGQSSSSIRQIDSYMSSI